MRKKSMVLNQETAMRLWNKQFGDETRVTDFANREIDKGAYNDRNSKYGWNVDHILPVSQGGKTNDSNLIVCHIQTNDEKADKFPCFTANGIKFEIVKVQNHYEIKKVEEKKEPASKKPAPKKDNAINFMDSAAGLKLFRKLETNARDDLYVGTIIIRFDSEDVDKASIIEFTKRLLGDDFNFEYRQRNSGYSYYGNSRIDQEISAVKYDIKSTEEIGSILQKCVMLNTYFCFYFKEAEYVKGFNIYYRIDCYDKYCGDSNIDEAIANKLDKDTSWSYFNTLKINKLVISNNNTAHERVGDPYYEYTEYDYIYPELKKNLLKEVDG